MRTRDENKEQAIRTKAMQMIVRDGFESFSMQKLAKEAGVSPATPYIYFRDKEDLILQLYAEESQKMAEATLKNFHPEMPFSEGLRVQWMNRAHYCLQNSESMHFLERIRHSALHEKAAERIGAGFMLTMKDFVKNAIQRNEIIQVPVEVYWSIAFAPLYNLIRFHESGTSVGNHKFRFSEKVMNQTLEIVLKALKP